MHITDLYIRGYGIFQDCWVQDISPGLNIFLGDNEAGKSTCLAFIRDVLFGAPDGRSKERSYPPLRGGRWGGSLGLAGSEWQRLLLKRGPGSRGGTLSITSPEGESLGPEVLNRLLAGTTREVFRNVYAFSLSELQTLETLSSERIKDAIYSAGLGAGLSSLPQVLKELENRRDKLFKTKGQNQSINQLLTRTETVRKEIRQAQGDIQAFDQVVQELQGLSQERESLKQSISSWQGRLSLLNSLLSRWEEWSEYQRLCQELQGLPLVEHFPANGLHRYQYLQDRLEHLQEQKQGLEQELQGLENKLLGLQPKQELLDLEQEIQAWAEDKGRLVQDQEEIPALEQRIQARQEELQATLRKLGSDWDQARIQALDTSLLLKKQLESHATSLQELESQKDQAARELQSRGQELSRAMAALEQAEKDLAYWGPAEQELDLALATELKKERDRFAQALEDLQARRQEREQGLRELNRILAEIGPQWSREDLQGLDTSLQAKERLESYSQDFSALEQKELHLQQELHSKSRRRQELQQRLQSRESSLQDLEEPAFGSLEEIRQARQNLQQLQAKQTAAEKCTLQMQALQDRIQDLQRQADSLQQQPQPEIVMPAAAAAALAGCMLLLLLAVLNILPWSAAWLPACILGLGSAGAGWQWLREKKLSSHKNTEIQASRAELEQEIQGLQHRLDSLAQEKADLEKELEELKKRLQPDRELDPAALEAELERSREVLHSRQSLQQELQELKNGLASAEQEIQDLEAQQAQKQKQRQSLQESWQQELARLGLDPGLGPASALRVLERAEAAKSELSHLQEAEGRLEHLQAFVERYASKAAQIPQAQEISLEQKEQLLSAVDLHLERMEQEQHRLKNRQLALQERNKKAEEAHRLQKEQDQAQQGLQQAEQDLQDQVAAWRQWLQDTGLHQELSPQLAQEALSHAEKAQALLAELKELQDKKKACIKRRQEFISRAGELAGRLGKHKPDAGRILAFLQGLLQELEASKTDAVRSKELQEQHQDRKQRLQNVQEKLSQAYKETQELLQQARAENEQDFLRLGRILEEREALQSRLQDLERSLLRSTGQSNIQDAQELFSSWSRSGLQQEISRLQQEIEESEAKRQDLSSRIGELNQEKQRLSSAEEVSRLRQEEECLRQELHQASLSWSRYTLALHLLRQAKAKYEQEQQPQVVRSAGGYLARITNQAYTQVYAPLGQGEVYAVDSLGQARHPEELSRGTAEQLYLSLRFGYVDNAGRFFEPLPVIMDDILVNFDPGRARNAARAISDLAQEHQVLYFTCHPHTLEYLQKAD
ncbi:MAG: AAA family ATPase, partial [Thermodesulfobacteriota bacterium]